MRACCLQASRASSWGPGIILLSGQRQCERSKSRLQAVGRVRGPALGLSTCQGTLAAKAETQRQNIQLKDRPAFPVPC